MRRSMLHAVDAANLYTLSIFKQAVKERQTAVEAKLVQQMAAHASWRLLNAATRKRKRR